MQWTLFIEQCAMQEIWFIQSQHHYFVFVLVIFCVCICNFLCLYLQFCLCLYLQRSVCLRQAEPTPSFWAHNALLISLFAFCAQDLFAQYFSSIIFCTHPIFCKIFWVKAFHLSGPAQWAERWGPSHCPHFVATSRTIFFLRTPSTPLNMQAAQIDLIWRCCFLVDDSSVDVHPKHEKVLKRGNTVWLRS